MSIIKVVEECGYEISNEQLADLVVMRQGADDVTGRADCDYFRTLVRRTQMLVSQGTDVTNPQAYAKRAADGMLEVVNKALLTKDMYPTKGVTAALIKELAEKRQSLTGFARSANSEWLYWVNSLRELDGKGKATILALNVHEVAKSAFSKNNTAHRKTVRSAAQAKDTAQEASGRELSTSSKGTPMTHAAVAVAHIQEIRDLNVGKHSRTTALLMIQKALVLVLDQVDNEGSVT
jgi:hypothetical protein